MSRAFYFAYGSNMCSSRLAERVGAVTIVGPATLEGARHRFNKLGNDGSAKGNFEPDQGSRILGVVYELAVTQLEALTRFEGGYESTVVEVAVQSRLVGATAFRAVVLSDTVRPHISYLEHYERGIREHGLPLEYLREIAPAWYFEEKLLDR